MNKVANVILIALTLAVVWQIGSQYVVGSSFETDDPAQYIDIRPDDRLPDIPLTQIAGPHGGPSTSTTTLLGILEPEGCTIVVLFRTDCPYCRQMADAWSDALKNPDFGEEGRSVLGRVRWVNLQEPDSTARAFVVDRQLSTSVYKVGTSAHRRAIGAAATPLLYVLDPEGIFLGLGKPETTGPGYADDIACRIEGKAGS